jgi:hypothetical protein
MRPTRRSCRPGVAGGGADDDRHDHDGERLGDRARRGHAVEQRRTDDGGRSEEQAAEDEQRRERHLGPRDRQQRERGAEAKQEGR